ncbi:Fe-S cluster assembly protein SufD [Novispirillum itersonii]|uniref:Fe-S cluster assembly protein SufD n=1 Tax=Novispirillum itersonii TaxID=189 RepID=UPI00036CBC39|nr:Fe-S cluster assembly protein SufD [Novispirillum itersonii]
MTALSLVTVTEAAQAATPLTDAALTALRNEGLTAFTAHGLPTRTHERWKYTRVSPLAEVSFIAAPATGDADVVRTAEGQALDVPGALRLVLVNGRLRTDLSDAAALTQAGISVQTLSDAIAADAAAVRSGLGQALALADNPFVALNTAALSDGLVIRVAATTQASTPLHLLWITAPTAGAAVLVQPRLLVEIGRGAALTLIESQTGRDGDSLTNRVSDITLADDARLTHISLHNDSRQARLLTALQARIQRGAVYDGFALTLGGALVRADLRVELLGPGAEARLNGAYAAGTGQHVDTTSFIDHAAPHCTSAQTLKGVLDGTGRGVFQGRVNVRRVAQKTDGHQLHKALLLSRGAEVDTKPELTIFADDVKCSHGAATGELDEDALFYLRARGLDADTARSLLIEGFLDDVVELVADEPLRDALTAKIHQWLESRS